MNEFWLKALQFYMLRFLYHKTLNSADSQPSLPHSDTSKISFFPQHDLDSHHPFLDPSFFSSQRILISAFRTPRCSNPLLLHRRSQPLFPKKTFLHPNPSHRQKNDVEFERREEKRRERITIRLIKILTFQIREKQERERENENEHDRTNEKHAIFEM